MCLHALHTATLSLAFGSHLNCPLLIWVFLDYHKVHPAPHVTTLLKHPLFFLFLLFLFFSFIFISWRQLLYSIVVGFVIHWHESAMELHVFPIPIPPPTSLTTRFLWVFPVHQVRALVSCIQPGLVICFTIDNIHALMLFSRNIPPSPSPTESKSLFCKSVSLFLFCI